MYVDAVQVIRDILKSPESSQERKRKHFANVAISEVYFEAIPTVFLSILILITSYKDSELSKFLFGEFEQDKPLFYFSFVTSMLSAAFGIAKLVWLKMVEFLAPTGALGEAISCVCPCICVLYAIEHSEWL